MKDWIVFRTKEGKELAAYTVNGTFVGEAKDTIDLLAREHDIPAEDISIILERRR